MRATAVSRVRNFFSRALCFAVPCLPVAATARLTALWSRGSPMIDDWYAAETLRRTLEGANVWVDFFQQRTLHIVPIEAIATNLVYLHARGDMRWLCALSLLIAAFTAWMLCRMASELLPGTTAVQRMLAHTWVTLCLFSPLQSETWLWGLCWTLTVPLAAFCAGWRLVRRDAPIWFRITGITLLCAIAFLSHSGGLAVPPALVVAIALASPAMVPKRRQFLTGWIATLLVLAALLALRFDFHRLSAAVGDATGQEAGPRPGLAHMATGFFALLGHPVALGTGWGSTVTSASAGIAIVTLAAFVVVRALGTPANASRAHAAAPWLAVIVFAFINAGLLAVTRAARSEWPTYTSRYVTLVTPAVLALVLLMVWAAREGILPRADVWRRTALPAACALAFAGVLAAWSEGLAWMQLWRAHQLQSEAIVAFTGALPITKLHSQTHKYPPDSIIPASAKFLQDHNALSGTPIFPDARLSNLHVRPTPLRAAMGGCSRAARNADGSLVLDGFADLRVKGRPADLVVLTAKKGDEGPVVIAGVVPACRLEYYRFDPKRLNTAANLTSWTLHVPAADLPADHGGLQLWAIDIAQRDAHMITADVPLDGSVPARAVPSATQR